LRYAQAARTPTLIKNFLQNGGKKNNVCCWDFGRRLKFVVLLLASPFLCSFSSASLLFYSLSLFFPNSFCVFHSSFLFLLWFLPGKLWFCWAAAGDEDVRRWSLADLVALLWWPSSPSLPFSCVLLLLLFFLSLFIFFHF
jgi:hypothetical protein